MQTSLSPSGPPSRRGVSVLALWATWLCGGFVVACASSSTAPSGAPGGDATSGGTSSSGAVMSSGSAGGGTSGVAAASGSTGAGTGSASSGAAVSDSDGSVVTEAAGSGSPSPFDASSSSDAAADDASTLGDAARAPGCAGLFCEDFESGQINPSVWDVKTSGGQTVVVQSVLAAHGKYAAQFHALPNVLSYDLLITKSAPAGLRGHHFGRAYFYVAPRPPAQHTTLLFAASAGFPTFKRLEVSSIGTGLQLTSVNQTGIYANSAALPTTTEAYSPLGGTLPVATWDCLEWEFNDVPDEIRAFLNGTLDVAYTNIVLGGAASGQVGGFVDFGFGYYAWHPAAYVFDMYYDDIVLDTKRVGCLP